MGTAREIRAAARRRAVARAAPLALLTLACGCAALARPAPPPAGSVSAQRLAPGPWVVERREATLVRSFVAEGAAPGTPPVPRVLTTSIWFPAGASEPRPLVVYSHGFLSNRMGGAYLAEHLASHGYVVAAPDHPRTRRWACGGTRVEDVVNQPADVRFVIDRLLDARTDVRPVPVHVDPERIGVMGLSLGGMTATLVAFHPRLRDPRVRAAVSIAGPMMLFEPRFFRTSPVDFMVVAGGADVIVPPDANAWPVLEEVPDADLVTIAGASHAGFDEAATTLLPGVVNPDRLGCWMLAHDLELERAAASPAFASFVRAEEGVAAPSVLPRPCATPPPHHVLDPRRQHDVTTLAVTAFFDATLAPRSSTRHAGARYLHEQLAHDYPEVHVLGGPRGG